MVNGAPLHDIGKIQIPDYLLNKPGRLTNEEFIQMQDHIVKGGEVIYRVNNMFDVQDGSYLQEAYNLRHCTIMNAGTEKDIRTVLKARKSLFLQG